MDGLKIWEELCDQVDDESLERDGNTVPRNMMKAIRQDAGVFFGIRKFKNVPGTQYIGKPCGIDGHVLVVGGAGSGKSSCIAIPTLTSWGGTIFAIDIKGELTEKWNELPEPKRPAKIFNLTKDQGIFASYDPFYFLRLDSEKDNLVQNAREIAQAIIPMPPNVTEPFWIQSAQHILTAALLHGSGIGASFNATMTRILTTPIWELIEEIADPKSKNLAAKLHINQFKGIKNPADNKMLTGISAELNNSVMVFVTNLQIKEALTPAADSIHWDDLETHHIFMRIAEDKLGQYDGAITLMLTQLIRSLERRQDKKYTPDKKPIVQSADGNEIPPTLLLLDEFPRLGKVDVIQNAVSTLRSKGVTICLIMQSLAQLDRTYGKETRQIIVDNCPYKAILQVTDPENQKIFSDMIGTINVSTTSIGQSGSESIGESKSTNKNSDDGAIKSTAKTKGISKGYSTSIGITREPLIHPHELASLKDILLMTPNGFCRVDKAPWYNPIPKDKPAKNPKPTARRKGNMNLLGISTPLITPEERLARRNQNQ